jgi:hypothetical protein
MRARFETLFQAVADLLRLGARLPTQEADLRKRKMGLRRSKTNLLCHITDLFCHKTNLLYAKANLFYWKVRVRAGISNLFRTGTRLARCRETLLRE